MCKVIAVSNQKGGVAKTTTTVNLGTGLARHGRKVLLIDADPQGSLSASLGYREPDSLETTLADIMGDIINEERPGPDEGILKHCEGVCLLPADIGLSGVEVSLVNIMGRENILREYVSIVADRYDYILVDCSPSLGMLAINALACADSVLIPVQAAYLPVKGLEQLIKTIGNVKRKLNSRLGIEGILLTMVDSRTNYARDISGMVHKAYGGNVEVFPFSIPQSVRVAEASAEGTSIYKHAPGSKAAAAYEMLVKEVLQNG